MGIFDIFKKGFQKSASAFSSGLKEIIIKKEIDDENLNKIEEFLIQSDVGIEVASEIKEIISKNKVDPKYKNVFKFSLSGFIKFIFDINYFSLIAIFLLYQFIKIEIEILKLK